MEIVWKVEIKSAKIVKRLEIFLSKLNLTRTFAAHHKKSFVPASVYMMVTCTIKRVPSVLFHRLSKVLSSQLLVFDLLLDGPYIFVEFYIFGSLRGRH